MSEHLQEQTVGPKCHPPSSWFFLEAHFEIATVTFNTSGSCHTLSFTSKFFCFEVNQA
jgi:hypothetical protein